MSDGVPQEEIVNEISQTRVFKIQFESLSIRALTLEEYESISRLLNQTVYDTIL